MTQDTTVDDATDSSTTSAAPAPCAYQRVSRSRKCRDAFDWSIGPYDHTRSESALWSAVLTQALLDALNGRRNAEADVDRRAAIRWLTGGGADFIMVCLLAGFDPDAIRCKVKKTLVCPRSWRAGPGEGRHYWRRRRLRERQKTHIIEQKSESDNVIAGPWSDR